MNRSGTWQAEQRLFRPPAAGCAPIPAKHPVIVQKKTSMPSTLPLLNVGLVIMASSTTLNIKKPISSSIDRHIAVIGTGPAGLSCAFQLARRGYAVTVFEALGEPGGMLRYGIPAFRLPRAVLDAEIKAITQMGLKSFAITSSARKAISRKFIIDSMRCSWGLEHTKGLSWIWQGKTPATS